MRTGTDKKNIVIDVDGRLATASIKDIRKATRQLNSDLVRMDRTSKEYADGSKQLQRYNKELLEHSKRIRNGSTAWDKFKTNAAGVMAGVFGANLLQTAISRVGQLISDGKELAEEMRGVLPAFEALDSPELLSNLREATKGTVSDLELMKSAVKADNFKIPLDNLAGYFAFATKRATETGESVDYLTESIINGIARKSLPILDNLGFSSTEVRAEMKKTGDMAAAVGNIIQREMGDGAEAMEFQVSKTQQLRATYENVAATVGNRVLGAFDSFAGVATKVLNVLGDLVGANERLSETTEQERVDLMVLERQILRTNLGTTERSRLIQELKDKYPGYLDHLDNDKAKNEDIKKAVDELNGSLLDKIMLMQSDEEIYDNAVDLAEATATQIELESKYERALLKRADAMGINLDKTKTLEEMTKELQTTAVELGLTNNGLTTTRGLLSSYEIGRLNRARGAIREYEQLDKELEQKRADLKDRLGLGDTPGADAVGGAGESDIEPELTDAELKARAAKLDRARKANAKARWEIRAELVQNLLHMETNLADEMERLLEEYVDNDEISAKQMVDQQEEAMARHRRDAAAHYELLILTTEDGTQAQLDARLNLLDIQMQQELANTELTEKEKLLIRERYAQEAAGISGDSTGDPRERLRQIEAVNRQLSDVLRDTIDQEAARVAAAEDQKLAALEQRLNKGLISEQKYTEEKQAIEQQYEKEKSKIKRQQFIADKAAAVVGTIMDTARAVMQAAPNIPLQIATGILGAAQVALITRQPVPEFGDGGMIGGRSHAQGGTLINAEAGEAIINKRSTALFAPMLSAINEAGGGKAFYKPGASVPRFDTGGVVQLQQSRGGDEYSGAAKHMMAAAMRMEQAVGNIKARAYITYTDMQDYEEENDKILEAGRF